MKKAILIMITLVGLTACQGPAPPATSTDLEALKSSMNRAFAGLEMYAADHSLRYPDSLETLIPKYLDEIPTDPVSKKAILYFKNDEGFFLSASGDYRGAGAEPGFPKMNQDGFYVKKASEFPTEE